MIIFISVLNFIDFILIDSEILEELRSNTTLSLLHDVLVAELQLDLVEALHIGVSDLTVLITVTFLHLFGPFYTIELKEKVQNEEWVDKVDEDKAHSTLGLDVDGQVEVVKLASELLVDQFVKLDLVQLYRDVFDHESCLEQNFFVTGVGCIQDPIKVYPVVQWIDRFLLLFNLTKDFLNMAFFP